MVLLFSGFVCSEWMNYFHPFWWNPKSEPRASALSLSLSRVPHHLQWSILLFFCCLWRALLFWLCLLRASRAIVVDMLLLFFSWEESMTYWRLVVVVVVVVVVAVVFVVEAWDIIADYDEIGTLLLLLRSCSFPLLLVTLGSLLLQLLLLPPWDLAPCPLVLASSSSAVSSRFLAFL